MASVSEGVSPDERRFRSYANSPNLTSSAREDMTIGWYDLSQRLVPPCVSLAWPLRGSSQVPYCMTAGGRADILRGGPVCLAIYHESCFITAVPKLPVSPMTFTTPKLSIRGWTIPSAGDLPQGRRESEGGEGGKDVLRCFVSG